MEISLVPRTDRPTRCCALSPRRLRTPGPSPASRIDFMTRFGPAHRGGLMGSLRLWSDEVEAMRPEARAAVEAGRGLFNRDPEAVRGLSRDERVARSRAEMQATTFPIDGTEEQ